MDRNTRHYRFGLSSSCIALALALIACPPVPKPVEPEVVPLPAPDPCQTACERMRELSCPEGDPNPAGDPCEVWLCQTHDSGIVDHNLPCLGSINSCDEIDGRCAK